jgi:aryl-alcohol dehydrogenase-like predicted oxidoreductase
MTMLYGALPGNPKRISRIVQGTSIGMVHTGNTEQAFALFDAVYANGITAFDTANQYGEGEVERTLGLWLRERGVADEVFVITKGAHHSVDRRRVTPFDITADLYDSLARLQVESIDLYLLHRDDLSVPVGPIIEILTEHQRAGRIRAFGASNWTHERVAEANAYAAEHGWTPFAASSPHFSLAEQVNPPWRDTVAIGGPPGEAARAWYLSRHMPIFAWSGLAGGFWLGKYTRDNLDSFSAEGDRLSIYCYASEDNFRRLDRVRALADAKGASIPQIALAYSLSHALKAFILVGHYNGIEAAHSVAACAITLSQAEMEWLDLRTDQQPDGQDAGLPLGIGA